MANRRHEFCDPIHDFIRVDSDERMVIDSPPLQRLRHIHQLAMTYLVYPGATHRRFEHSLGTMELAGRVYDAITGPSATRDYAREVFPEIDDEQTRMYWKRVIRLAALCHDIGHLPYSHAAEDELLPEGWSHEKLSRDIIFSELSGLFNDMTPPVKVEHVAKLAVGPNKAPDMSFSSWERILAEIIVGDAFGVDRMDYLLRDSLHAGVVYGNFGHHRLIDTLRILPSPGRSRKQRGYVSGCGDRWTSVSRGSTDGTILYVLSSVFPSSQNDIRPASDRFSKKMASRWKDYRSKIFHFVNRQRSGSGNILCGKRQNKTRSLMGKAFSKQRSF